VTRSGKQSPSQSSISIIDQKLARPIYQRSGRNVSVNGPFGRRVIGGTASQP